MGNAGEGAFDVELVGRGEDHPVRTLCRQQAGQVGEQRHAEAVGEGGGSGERVDDGSQLALGAGLDQFDMAAADQPGAGHGNADLLHGSLLFFWYLLQGKAGFVRG